MEPVKTSTVTQLGMNLKAYVPDMGSDTIVTTITPGWKDTRLKIGLAGGDGTITLRSLGKSLARTAIESDPFMITKQNFLDIIASILGRQFGADRKLLVRKDNAHEVQYTSLASAIDSSLKGKFTDEQRNALTIWIAATLEDGARLVRWGGPVDIIVSRRTDRILATDALIRTEHLVERYINQYESRVKPAMSNLLKFLTERVGYYDVNTIAENLFLAWTQQQIEVRQEKAMFISREAQFKQALFYLLKGLPTIPDPMSSISEISEFLKVSNYLLDLNFNELKATPPQSFAEAREFIRTVRSIAANPNTKIEVVPTLSLAKYFSVRTTGFKAGMDSSELRDVSLNYRGSEVVRAGEMVEFMGPYKQWSEDPALSANLSAVLKAVLGNLRQIKEIRLEVWANVVDNLSDVGLWLEDTAGSSRLLELDRVMQAFALSSASFITRDTEKWVYGLLTPTALTMSSSDAAYSIRGTTTKRHEVAVALMLTDKDGDPLIANPTPFYKSDRGSMLLATENVHFRALKNDMGADEEGDMLPTVTAEVIATDGVGFTTSFPFSSIVPGTYPTTRNLLSNVALGSEVAHLTAQLSESLALDQVLTGELLIPTVKQLAKIATDAYASFVENEILGFPAGMSAVMRNRFRMYTTLNSMNILVAVCKFIDPELASLVDSLFTFAVTDPKNVNTVLGVL